MWPNGSNIRLRPVLIWGLTCISLATLSLTELPLRLEVGAIRIYQGHASPLVSYVVTCRFEPSCSSYALKALREWGFWLGNYRIAGRLLMCSPIGYLIDASNPGGSGSIDLTDRIFQIEKYDFAIGVPG